MNLLRSIGELLTGWSEPADSTSIAALLRHAFPPAYRALAMALVMSFFLSRWLTGWSRTLALRWGIVSHVTSRSSHTVATPRLGGLGLGLAYGISGAFLLVTLWLLPHDPLSIGYNPSVIRWITLGWLIMFATGLLDDIFDLSPALKMGLMIIGALAPVLGAQLTPSLPIWPWLTSDMRLFLGAAIAVFWILFFTNAFNFMDGMDGFAASFALCAMLAIFGAVFVKGTLLRTLDFVRGEAYLLLVIAIACRSFLRWNKPPAKTFMGDGGSLGLGYALAVFALLGAGGELGQPFPMRASLTVLMPFIFDVVLTLIRRARAGRKLWVAHREHLYQRLMQTGLTHGQVLYMNVWRFIVCGLAGIAASYDSSLASWIPTAFAILLMIDYWQRTLILEYAAAERRAAETSSESQNENNRPS